ncbi:MAG: DUF1080 domain-containing protein [Elusimicrobia bacterium]|nr:DUF1080 domain-containing protein [Elusimicrobiota bacterium]
MNKGLLLCLGLLTPSVFGYVKEPTASIILGFDETPVGQRPTNFSFEITGQGPAVQWAVLKDVTAPSPPKILAQLGRANSGNNFPLAIFDGVTLQDGDLSVQFKAVAGKEDQAGGIVWRYKDRNNYYLVRANALEENVVLYKVKEGKRRPLPPKGRSSSYGVKTKVPSGRWNSLRVTVRGTLFVVYCNGEKLFEVEDSTFQEPGKIGLWTKADSVTYFDDFEVKPFDEKPVH